FCQLCFGRRDQQGTCKSAVRIAGGHAGKTDHHFRSNLSPSPTIFGAGNTEPSGTGRNLSPTRSPGRPFHAESGALLSKERIRSVDHLKQPHIRGHTKIQPVPTSTRS